MKMTAPKIFLVIVGLAIIIAGFLSFGEHTQAKYLCMVVTSVIYFLWIGQAFIPWLNRNDRADREIGSIGVQWYGLFLYTVAAIAAMVITNIMVEVSFGVQTVIHMILLFLLLGILILGKGVEDQVATVHEKEAVLTEARDVIKTGLNGLRRKLSIKADLPPWILERVATMEDEARYISPNNTQRAQDLDSEFAESLKKVETALDSGEFNQIETDELIKMCEITLTERKRALN